MSDDGSYRKIEFPCGFSAKFKVGETEEPGDERDFEFSTKHCFSFRQDCTNPDGHQDNRCLGTERFPHVEMTCRGTIQQKISDDYRERFILKKAKTEWGGRVEDVYWKDESVYRAVDDEYETIGYVLVEGAPSEYIQQSEYPWVFYRGS